MTLNTFGYVNTPLPSTVSQYEDYLVGRYPDFEPSDWDNIDKINIRTLWESIKYESDEETRGLVEMWRRIEVLLEATRSALEQHALALQQRWTSPAGAEFLRRVGAALFSLDQWRAAAAANKTAMNTVADEIEKKQGPMRQLWIDYVAADDEAARRRQEERTDSVLMSIGRGFTEDPPSYQEVLEDYTARAKPMMKELADVYVDSALALDRGTTYKGPKSANVPVVDINAYGGGQPGSGPAVPTMPTMPPLPFPDLPPLNVPEGPQFAGVATLPAPNLPGTPTLPSVPGGGHAPGMPFLPGLPGVPGVPGAPGPAPGGRSAPPTATPPRAPGRPTLPGTSARSGAPGAPGLPGRPNLRGSTAGAAGGPPAGAGSTPPGMRGRPAGQPAASPLHGRRGGAAGSGSVAGPGGAGQPRRPVPGGSAKSASSPLAGRRAPEPGTTPPRRAGGRPVPGRTLGTSARQANPSPTNPQGQPQPGARSQLDGRRLQAERGDAGRGAANAARRRRRTDESSSGSAHASDEQLWTVESAGANLDTPPAPPPQINPGRAIGRDA